MNDRHDRTIRFLRCEMGWEVPPSREALLEVSSQLTVTLRVPQVASVRQRNLLALAIGNVVGRLPVGSIRFEIAPGSLGLYVPPYRGATIHEALDDLTTRLETTSSIARCSGPGHLQVDITTRRTGTSWALAVDGPAAYLGRSPHATTPTYDPVGPYTAASMVGGEVLRTLARSAAAANAGTPGRRFQSRTAPASDRWLNLCPHDPTPSTQAPARPVDVDWVSCGAVNQGILAVLGASPDFEVAGTVFDPGILDAPDLNRSLLSFPQDLGRPKARVGTEAIDGDVRWRQGRYPDALRGDARAPWVVCGTDDPSARPECQRLWPDRLVVTATETVFGYAAWHGPDTPDAFCGACQPAPPLQPGTPIPTTAPTSVATAVATAAVIRSLAASEQPAHRLDLLTLRLDSRFAVERSNPPPSSDCTVCSDLRPVPIRRPP